MKLYQNGVILTMDAEGSRAGAMAVEGDRIVQVGEEEELRRAFPEAEIADLGGKTVMPGFIESHVHLLNYAYSLTKIDCAPMKSLKELVEASREYIREKQIPLGTWVLGRGWNQTFFRGEEKSHDCGSGRCQHGTSDCVYESLRAHGGGQLHGFIPGGNYEGQRKSGGRRN